MIITGPKTIRKLDSHLILESGESFYVGLKLTGTNIALAKNLGFSEELKHGEQILPSMKAGKQYKYNIVGREKIDRTRREDVVKELPYRVTDWHGTEHTGTYFRTYERFRKYRVGNYNLELSIIHNAGDILLIVNKKFNYIKAQEDEIISAINLILSFFLEANIFKENLKLYDTTNYERVYWEIIPSGDAPFEKIKTIIEARYIEPYKRGPIIKRQEFLESLSPTNRFRGVGGFGDYIAYVYESRGITILESTEYGNAIYIVGLDWMEISKKTKKEILDGGLEKERIVHTENYYKNIRRYF